jgi:selenoprotein W-related protein
VLQAARGHAPTLAGSGPGRNGGWHDALVSELPRVEVRYCTQCNWMLRAAWVAQELLQTFAGDVREVALVPTTGGEFEVLVDERLVWSRRERGRFPEPKELKRAVRDVVAPGRVLGHADRAHAD